jgi:hypothetical protein
VHGVGNFAGQFRRRGARAISSSAGAGCAERRRGAVRRGDRAGEVRRGR